jgi:MFS family permease
MQVAAFLLHRRSFIHIAVGSGLAAFVGYASISFFASFLYRSHGLPLTEIGFYLGLIYGIGGALGFAGGGFVADSIGRYDRRKSLLGVAAALLLAAIVSVPVYLLESPYLALLLFIVPVVFSNFYLATTFAQVQSMVGLRMRAVASALLLLILNVIGLGLGPQVTGIMSDWLAADYGVDSLRYSLLIISCVIGPWSALHYLIASKSIVSDLDRVDER